MKYTFPTITHIDQVLKAIEGQQEFIVAVKDGGYTVVNYAYQTDQTFPDPSEEGIAPEESIRRSILRECRGIKFDTASGNILVRPLQKFFNINEKAETQQNLVDLTSPHLMLHKLDGSMITPLPVKGGIRWATKMGVTEVALPVEEFVVQNPAYEYMAREAIAQGITLIFEWCSPKQQIVIKYPQDTLILLAIRDNITGVYWTYDEMKEFVKLYFGYLGEPYPIVGFHLSDSSNTLDVIKHTKDLQDHEGYVIRFETGHAVKAKSDWYLTRHRARDAVLQEYGLVNMIVTESIDDVLGSLSDEDARKVRNYVNTFWANVQNTVDDLFGKLNSWKEQSNHDRKAFALQIAPALDSKIRSLAFECWDKTAKEDVFKSVVKTISKHSTAVNRLNEVRDLFAPIKWDLWGVE